MRLFNIRWATTLSAVILALNSYAGDNDSKKEIVPMEPPAPSRWSVSAGPTVSSIKTTFSEDPALVTLLDPSLYNGGSLQTYLNGTVGIGGPNNTFTGYTGFSGGVLGVINADNRTETFTGVNYGPTPSVSDTELSLGGYVKLAYDAFDFGGDSMHLSPFFQYTFTTAFDSGIEPVPASLGTYTYYSATSRDLAGLLEYVPNTHLGVAYPFQTASPLYVGAGINSSVNIYMHTFTLGFDFTKDLTDRVHLVVSTGPTLNLFETDLNSAVSGPNLVPMWARDQESKLEFGWVGQLGVQVDLDSKKQWFVEASGNYHWVTPFTVSTALSSAKIDASSLGAELGLGYRF